MSSPPTASPATPAPKRDAGPRAAETSEPTRANPSPQRIQNTPTASPTESKVSADSLPLFDAHLHYIEGMTLTELAALLKKEGYSGTVLFSLPSNAANELGAVEKQQPNFVFPFAQFAIKTGSNANQVVSALEKQLDANQWKGLGEESLRHTAGAGISGNDYPADGPVALAVYELSARRKVPVTVHIENPYTAELDRALTSQKDAVVIWAHLGDAPPATIRDMLKKHPKLYVDISARNPFWKRIDTLEEQSLANADGTIKSDWKAVFEEFSDRVLFGTDLNAQRIKDLNKITQYYRPLFKQLTLATAEKIASKNIKQLLGIK
ncbi:MAG: amidohydrolase family protein [Chloroflexi bacterium]|nr:amidohydrolase family protein [Chloroflexota bacterium]